MKPLTELTDNQLIMYALERLMYSTGVSKSTDDRCLMDELWVRYNKEE